MSHDVGDILFAKRIWDSLEAMCGTFTMLHTVVHLREFTTTMKKSGDGNASGGGGAVALFASVSKQECTKHKWYLDSAGTDSCQMM